MKFLRDRNNRKYFKVIRLAIGLWFLSIGYTVIAGENYSLGSEFKNSGNKYYVSGNGNDTLNTGTLEQPLKTIYAALNIAVSNDTIILMDGIYQESNTIVRDYITIKAQKGASPVISGLDTINNWTLHEGNIYKAVVSGKVSQVFTENNGKLNQMVYARYPNLAYDNLFMQTYARADVIDYNSHASSSLTDGDLSGLSGINVIGAALWMPYPFDTKWNSHSEIITSQTSSTLGFNATKDEANLDEGRNTYVDYHLTGVLSLLDAENEWFYDKVKKELYFYAPQGIDPNNLSVLARTRDVSINISNKNGISVEGITFIATGLIAKGNNLTIRKCNFYYPTPFFNTERWKDRADFSVQGDGNLIEKCEVANSWGTGISMRNSTNSSIDNCLVRNCNWSGSISPGIWISGTNLTASKNTVYSVGRSGIRIYPIYNSLFEKNHIYDYGLINHDLGSIKGGLQDYKHTVWRYNLSHDFNDSRSIAKAGIYLDASNDNATVHHNVNYGVHLSINGNVNNDSIINNTLVRQSGDKVWSHYIRPGNDWQYRTVYTYNNLATSEVKGTDRQNNIVANINAFKFAGAEYGDFRLLPNSPAIDYAVRVNGINDDFMGEAPDAGAYEFSDTGINGNWIAGITWSPEWNTMPQAEIEVEPDSVYPSVYYISVKNDMDNGWIMRYDWDFGDGTGLYGKTVTHMYKQNGEHSIALTVRDNLAGTSVIKKNIIIDLIPVSFQVYTISDTNVDPANGADITINGDLRLTTDTLGRDSILLTPGKYFYRISHKGYNAITDTLELGAGGIILRDTLTETTYNVEITVKDKDTGEPVSASQLDFNGEKQIANESGQVVYNGVEYSSYTLSISADNYLTESFSSIEIFSDTNLVFYISQDYPEVILKVMEFGTNDPIYRAIIYYNDETNATDRTGETSLEKVSKGMLIFSVEYQNFHTLIDSLMIQGDTNLVLELKPALADLNFMITDSEKPLDNTAITVNNTSFYSNASGMVYLLSRPTQKDYFIDIDKSGYIPVQDTIWLEKDTLLNYQLEKVTSVSNHITGSLIIYPNPVSEKLFFEGLPADSRYRIEISDATGTLYISENVPSIPGSIDLSCLADGLYIMKFIRPDYSIIVKYFIKIDPGSIMGL